jgi:hypothetical protein
MPGQDSDPESTTESGRDWRGIRVQLRLRQSGLLIVPSMRWSRGDAESGPLAAGSRGGSEGQRFVREPTGFVPAVRFAAQQRSLIRKQDR